MNPRNKAIHGMLGGVVQRAPASPLYDKLPGEGAMDLFRRTGVVLPIAGGADEDEHYDQLPEEIRGQLGDVTQLNDEEIEALEGQLGEIARDEATELGQVEQAVEAVTALRTERTAREEAAAAEATRRSELLSQLDDTGDGESAEGESAGTDAGNGDGTDGDGTDGTEGTDGDGGETDTEVTTPGGTEVSETTPAGTEGEGEGTGNGEGTTAAGGRRAPARAAARRPSPGAMGRRRPADQGARRTPAAESTRIEDVNGNVLTDFRAAAERLIATQDALGRGGGDGDFVRVGRLTVDVPRDRQITDPQNGEANAAIVAAVSGPEAIVAAGGLCAPSAVDYDLVNISDASRPVRDSLPQISANRGGVRFARPVNFDALAGAVDIWTTTDDADAVDDENVRKPCIRVDCNDFDEVFVRAIPWCLTFGNLGARAWPEQVADAMRSVLAMHSRIAEAELLKDIGDAGTDVTVPQTVSATRDILDALGRGIARYRYHFRTAETFPLRAVMPRWLRELIRSDLARELPGSTDERLAVADATIQTFFAARNVNVTWRADEERGTTADDTFYGAQAAGALLGFPDSVRINLFHEGAFGFLSMPDIDFGVVRDSSLNARNDYQIMAETFEGVLHRGFQSLNLDIDLCPSGATSGTLDFDCPAASGGS